MSVLQLEDDIRCQEATWKFERTGWWLLLVCGLAALLGLLGGNPLIRQTKRMGQAVVEFDPIVRSKSDTDIQIKVGALVLGETEIWISDDTFEKAKLVHVTPEANESALVNEGYALRYKAGTYGEGAEVHFTVQPENIGFIDYRILVNGKDELKFRQFALP